MPRVIVLLMLGVAGGAAFLSSAVALYSGLEAMWARYALATVSGYAVFLLMIRAWIGIRRGWIPGDGATEKDVADVVDMIDGAGTGPRGGSVSTASGGFDLSIDLDELWWLAVVAMVAGAGLIAVAFVVYSAPVLLAEVALDAALVGTIYRRLRREEQGYWAATAIRKTWVAGTVLVVSMAVLGTALHQLAPESVSIGDVVRHFQPR